MGIILKLLLGLLTIVAAQHPHIKKKDMEFEICNTWAKDMLKTTLFEPIETTLLQRNSADNCDVKYMNELEEFYRLHKKNSEADSIVKSKADCFATQRDAITFSRDDIKQAARDMVDAYCSN